MRFDQISNDDLLSSLRSFVGDERRLITKVVAYLVEVERRRLHLELACSSMFDFCTRLLGLSEGEAYRRLTAARLVARYPRLLDAIEARQIHLSNIVLLKDLFTDANVDELTTAAAGKSKREVEDLVAKRAPKPDVAASIRKLPQCRDASPSPLPTGAPPLPTGATCITPVPTGAPPPRTAPSAAPAIAPLSEDRFKIQLTASAALRSKLERARALMRSRNPSGDLAAVVEAAVDVLLAKLEKEKLGKTERPQTRPRSSAPAHVTSATRREVVARDGGHCTFTSPTGERCPARELLELDHRHPRARGGTGDAANIRLLCRAHNTYEAERIFGQSFIANRIHLRQNKRLAHPLQTKPHATATSKTLKPAADDP